MKSTHTSQRIVIIGGGFAGLAIAVRLAQAGLPVTVFEASKLGGGASTRNQGWLHSGGWFALDQVELARMCYDSLQRTLEFCPECVESDPESMVYLTSQQATDPQRLTAAWDAAGIPYQAVGSDELFERFPGLSISQALHAFQLPDRSMRTDLLISRLVEAAERAGAEIRSETPVRRLIQEGESVQGVELGPGRQVAARMVILAGNASGGQLFPGYGAEPLGPRRDVGLVMVKTHLVAIRPEFSRWPFCVVDAEGFNHIPHHPASVFGTNRWLPVRQGDDDQPDASETERIWTHVARFFPDFERGDHQITEWAGVTAQAMHLDSIDAAQVPLPIVVDHQQENPRMENLVSVFPGRATLWAHLAEKTAELVLAKVGKVPQAVATPPWGLLGQPSTSLL